MKKKTLKKKRQYNISLTERKNRSEAMKKLWAKRRGNKVEPKDGLMSGIDKDICTLILSLSELRDKVKHIKQVVG